MRILTFTDVEGVASVFHPEQTRTGNGECERARHQATAEADAAVCGISGGGAANVLVSDSRGGSRNLIPNSIGCRTRFVLGKLRCPGMTAGADGCDIVCMIGYHARAGSRGVLTHTISSFAFARVWFNEQELGEAGLCGALAGEHGAPVAVASGDDIFIKETEPLLSYTTFVETEQAEGQDAGTLLSSEQLYEAAYTAVKTTARRDHFNTPLHLWVPIACRPQTQTPALADLLCQ